jgi:hypothetical protein
VCNLQHISCLHRINFRRRVIIHLYYLCEPRETTSGQWWRTVYTHHNTSLADKSLISITVSKRERAHVILSEVILFEMTLCWLALVVIFIVGNAEALVWNGDGTDTRWSLQCDFIGRDLKNQISPASQCGSLCKANSPCSHFTWTNFNVSSLPFHFTSFSFIRIIMQAIT